MPRTLWLTLLAAALACPASASPPRPRLLLTPGDVDRLRHECGLGHPQAERAGWGVFGARRDDYQALRGVLGEDVQAALPGELAAAGLLHLLNPGDWRDAERVALIGRALQDSGAAGVDPIERAIALDWAWDALDPALRSDFVAGAATRAQPLAPTDSPLEPGAYREKLAWVALALAVDEQDDPSRAWKERRERVLAAAAKHFEETLPAFIRWRGPTPTGPARADEEEALTALAVECAGAVLNRDVWATQRDGAGRWMEHYWLSTFAHPALAAHGFLRDDAGPAATLPGQTWSRLEPLSAALLAARTRNPAAAEVALRVAESIRGGGDAQRAAWRWVVVAFGPPPGAARAPLPLPTARNLGSAVVLRGGDGADAVGVWIETGQPLLRPRQHLDAGHFLIQRGGRLAVSGGDDVSAASAAVNGGAQHLGARREPFEFDDYCVSTIAHNCIVAYDPGRPSTMGTRRFLPAGGQRGITDVCRDFAAPPEAQDRATARQIAYGKRGASAYVALDLAPAYDRRVIASYSREFVFVEGAALIVIDRLKAGPSRITPTWIVNIPARPNVDGADLKDAARAAGVDNTAGVWRVEAARVLHWADRDGALWHFPLLPPERRVRAAGGPGRREVFGADAAARSYLGSSAAGFERLILPSDRRGADNAWYRLGSAALVPASVGAMPHWGRIEVEPAQPGGAFVFVNALVTDRADAKAPPEVRASAAAAGGTDIAFDLGAVRGRLWIPAEATGGSLSIDAPRTVEWPLPSEVEPDEPLSAASQPGER